MSKVEEKINSLLEVVNWFAVIFFVISVFVLLNVIVMAIDPGAKW